MASAPVGDGLFVGDPVIHSCNQLVKRYAVTHFAFPDYHHAPPLLPEQHHLALIPQSVGIDFFSPELGVGSWCLKVPTVMAVPETAINKQDGSVTGKNQVRLARKRRVMKTVTKTLGMKDATDEHFRFGVLAPDGGHHPAARDRINYVSHLGGAIGEQPQFILA